MLCVNRVDCQSRSLYFAPLRFDFLMALLQTLNNNSTQEMMSIIGLVFRFFSLGYLDPAVVDGAAHISSALNTYTYYMTVYIYLLSSFYQLHILLHRVLWYCGIVCVYLMISCVCVAAAGYIMTEHEKNGRDTADGFCVDHPVFSLLLFFFLSIYDDSVRSNSSSSSSSSYSPLSDCSPTQIDRVRISQQISSCFFFFFMSA